MATSWDLVYPILLIIMLVLSATIVGWVMWDIAWNEKRFGWLLVYIIASFPLGFAVARNVVDSFWTVATWVDAVFYMAFHLAIVGTVMLVVHVIVFLFVRKRPPEEYGWFPPSRLDR
jgi:hypothetical protein